MEHQTILTAALEKLYETTGFRLEPVEREPQTKATPNVLVRLRTQDKDQTWTVECRTTVTKDTAGAVVHYTRQPAGKVLLIAEYVPPGVGEQLRANRVAFLDTAGNAFINEPPVYIDIRGHKLPTRKWKDQLRGAAFRPTGLQIVFGFLCDPELINQPYRTIAKKVGVAHGTVGWAMRDLNELGFLLKMETKKKKLVRRDELLKVWVERYAETLRPKLVIGRYTVGDLERFKQTPLTKYRALWGGEPAAEQFTNYLTPATWTIYMHDDPKKFIVLNALREEERGNIELLRTFWAPDFIPGGKDTVPPVLVYADLLASGQARNLETAKLLYDRELVKFIGQN